MDIIIKPNELRLGNLVRAKSPEVTKYEEPVTMDHHYLKLFSNSPQNINVLGIPLTEDWLLKFGAKKNVLTGSDPVVYYDLGNLTICDWGNGLVMSNAYSTTNRLKLTSVHQLQNLYFALTTEELVYNPSYKPNEKIEVNSLKYIKCKRLRNNKIIGVLYAKDWWDYELIQSNNLVLNTDLVVAEWFDYHDGEKSNIEGKTTLAICHSMKEAYILLYAIED